MVPRKQRIRAVLDTNVLIRALKTRNRTNPNQRVIRLWLLEKRLQHVVCRELVDEYLGVFDEILALDQELIEEWSLRFVSDARSTVVNLGRRYTKSRDPDDNLLLATATAGHANYLVSNDLDLLELPASFQQSLRFEIVTPREFIRTAGV